MIRKPIYLSLLLLLTGLLVAACGEPRKIQLHAVRLSDDNGASPSTLITSDQIKIWVDAANDIYDVANYQFLFDPSQDMSDGKSTILNTVPPDGDQQAWNQYGGLGNVLWLWFYPDKGVIYFRGRGGGGWSWGPEGPGPTAFVSMPFYNNTNIAKPSPGSPNDTLLAHELGHFLGLAHTFPGFTCEGANPPCNPCTQLTLQNADADVGGQLGNTADDDVGDTDPDPRADCAPTTTLNCPGGTVPVNSITFDPPWQNMMSYHDCLPEDMTLRQIQVINRTLEHPWRAPIRRN